MHIDEVIERIPVLGREGPDLTFPNVLSLAVDVKSRKSVPITPFYLVGQSPAAFLGDLAMIRLGQLHQAYPHTEPWPSGDYASKMISDWHCHIDKWAQSADDFGVGGLVLHRPGMRISQSLLVFARHRVSDVFCVIDEMLYGRTPPDACRRRATTHMEEHQDAE